MTQLIKVKIKDSEFWIEPDNDLVTERKAVKASITEDLIEKSLDFNVLSKQVGNICELLKQSLDSVPKELRPTKVSTEFGFKISGEGDIVLVKAGIEATLKISAEWQFS